MQNLKDSSTTKLTEVKGLTESLLRVEGLRVYYRGLRGLTKAVDNTSLEVREGEILGLVGESGSGKSTLAHAILRVLPPAAGIFGGSILFKGSNDILKISEDRFKKLIRWRRISLVPQVALNALNPTMRIAEHFIETAKAHGLDSREDVLNKASELLKFLRLEPKRVLPSYPHELSGGMKQRILIAMSLLLDPTLLILDEPTTALDVVTQRYILDLLRDIRDKLSITMVVITHDISIEAYLADRLAVMYAGKIVEVGEVYHIFKEPLHPYTIGLIKSIPKLTGSIEDMRSIPGSPPDLVSPPPGCRFHTRCPYAMDVCGRDEPPLVEVEPGHYVACWLYMRR